MDRQTLAGKPVAGLISRLDQAHPNARPRLLYANRSQFFGVFDPVEVGMKDWHMLVAWPGAIFVDQHKAWTVDQLGRAKPLDNAFDHMGFASPEIAQQHHQIALAHQLAQALAKSDRLRGTVA